MSKIVLIIAAHPDDEALGCAGTIARHSAEGDHVHIVYMTDGFSSRDANNSEIEDRQYAANQSNKILGIQQSCFLKFPDNQMDSIPLLDIIKPLEKIINNIKPEIIYTHHSHDLNIDHQITFQAALTICRPQPNFSVKEIYSFEVISSTEWSNPYDQPFVPNHFIDITHFLEQKYLSIQAYEAEMRLPPHSRCLEHIKSLATHRGHSIGVEAAEAFMLIRSKR